MWAKIDDCPTGCYSDESLYLVDFLDDRKSSIFESRLKHGTYQTTQLICHPRLYGAGYASSVYWFVRLVVEFQARDLKSGHLHYVSIPSIPTVDVCKHV